MTPPADKQPIPATRDLPPGTRLLAAVVILGIILMFVVKYWGDDRQEQDSCRISVATHGLACASTHAGTIRQT